VTIQEYVEKFSERGGCKCGKCMAVNPRPDPVGHTADTMFFKVAMKEGATAEEFIRLSKEYPGEFGPCDLFDGKEHNFMEIGGWIGDQGLALRFMGLGNLLGVFDLLTPRSVLGGLIDDKMAMDLAGKGMVTVQTKKEKPCPK
jgi:hypothetical protein